MSNSEVYQLFVYGSLRSGFNLPAFEYIRNFFTLVGKAKVAGKIYDIGNFPGGVPSSDNNFITGELYRINNINEFPWAIGQLDDYEGVNVVPGEVKLFRRDITEVYLDGQVTHAWIYWYNRDVRGMPLIASGDLMQYLQQKK